MYEVFDKNTARKKRMKSEKVVYVHAVNSMYDFINRNHKRTIYNAILRAAADGSMSYLIPFTSALKVSDCKPCFISCSLVTKSVISAICFLRLTDHEQQISTDIACDLHISVRNNMKLLSSETIPVSAELSHPVSPVSCYLVPILSGETIDVKAEQYLSTNDLFDGNNAPDPFEIARFMGLNVTKLSLHDRKKTRSILFFAPSQVAVNGAIQEPGKPTVELVDIPGNTIVLNTHYGSHEVALFHECAHHLLHHNFFCLQKKLNSDKSSFRTVKKKIPADKQANDPIRWMEWQAARCSLAFMMPLSLMNKEISSRQYDGNFYQNSGYYYDSLCRRIAQKYDWPKACVRSRMIQLGHEGAYGCLNYVDEKYIDPFAFTPGICDFNHGFVIDSEGYHDLLKTNADLRNLVDWGDYVYADGHICMNSDQYVRMEDGVLKLTSLARSRVDMCCLRLERKCESDANVEDYEYGCLRCDEEYLRSFYGLAEGEKLTREASRRNHEMVDHMGNTVHDAIAYLRKAKGYTVQEFAEEAQISVRFASELCNHEREEYSIDLFMSIVIGLHLSPPFSTRLMFLAGLTPRNTERSFLLEDVRHTRFMDSMESIQEYLDDMGVERITIDTQNKAIS